MTNMNKTIEKLMESGVVRIDVTDHIESVMTMLYEANIKTPAGTYTAWMSKEDIDSMIDSSDNLGFGLSVTGKETVATCGLRHTTEKRYAYTNKYMELSAEEKKKLPPYYSISLIPVEE